MCCSMEKEKRDNPNIAMEIRIFITDIDGVWTDGGMYYDNGGEEWKKFNTSDSAGVVFLKALGIPVAIITGEHTRIVARRAEKLGIEDLYMGIKDKVKAAEELLDKYGIAWNEAAYIGDDINDIRLMRKVGLSACPASAEDYIKSEADWILEKKGGEGVFREFVQRYLSQSGKLEKVIDILINKPNE